MNKQLNSQQSGFTLIELIMVIVILGVLAVTVLPRYVNLQGQANQSALDGVAGAVAAGAAINYAACVSGNAACMTSATPAPKAITDCAGIALTVAGGTSGVPAAGYTIADAFTAGAVAGDSVPCTVTQTASGLTEVVNVIDPG